MKSLLAVLVCLMAAGCSAEQPAADTTTAPARPPRTHRPAAPARRDAVKIVSVEPGEMVITKGRGVPGEYVVTYSIGEPDTVEKAELTIYLPGTDEVIMKQDVPIVLDDAVSIVISPRFDFGPVLRFRAVCPQGTTDWYTFGQEPLPYEDRVGPGLKIAGMGPQSIFYNLTGQPGGTVHITLLGRELGPGCTPEGQVDGQPLAVIAPMAQKGRIEGAIRRDDFGDTAIAKRYLEVKLSVKGPGFAKVAIAHIRFVE